MSTGSGGGRAQLEAIRDGRAPVAPIQRVLDFDLTDVGDGTAVFSYRPSAEHRNPMGTVHGGVAMTLLDSATGAAVHSTLSDGEVYATLETKVHLVRPIRTDDDELRAEGEVVHRGGTIATAQARLLDAEGRIVAHGT